MFIKEGPTDYIRGGTQRDIYSPEDTIEVPCPLCGSTDRAHLYTEHGAVGIGQCRQCDLIYTSPRVSAPEEIYWGDAETYYQEARLVFQGRAPHHRDVNYLEELDLIQRFRPAGRFLDVGCNMGMLMRLARKRRWEVIGVDPSPSLSRLAREHFGHTVHNCFVQDLPVELERSFDVVALSDVFEHISEPLPFLHEVKRFLKPDGVLYIKVPNGRWNLFKQKLLALRGRTPAHGLWDSCEHVVHYTDRTLARMLEKAGLTLLTCTIGKPIQTPVWHDYVGHYYQYPSPWVLDWRRQTGRTACYLLSKVERVLRGGSIGALAPNIAVIAQQSSLG